MKYTFLYILAGVVLATMAIAQSTTAEPDKIMRLQEQLDNGAAKLEFDSQGYVKSLLKALDIPVSSQGLVFSKTSVQRDMITPGTPRAVFFNDDIYLAYLRGAQFIEIVTTDPQKRLAFYLLEQQNEKPPKFERQTSMCQVCHDPHYTGPAQLLMTSHFTDKEGNPLQSSNPEQTRQLSFNITDHSPMNERFGGWYVTGTHGDQLTMGNLVSSLASRDIGTNPLGYAKTLNLARGANLTDLSKLFDTTWYPSRHSDIVALMTLIHQVNAQNYIIRAVTELENALRTDEKIGIHSPTPSPARMGKVQDAVEQLVRVLLFADEAQLKSPIKGTSGFAEEFAERGPKDRQGRSLRQFDLQRRLFRYPLSYMIYSQAFDQMPDLLKQYTYSRLAEILTGKDTSGAYGNLAQADRQAILEILDETKPEFKSTVLGTASEF